ncbi:MAG TPA: nitrilase-related carbon-nitrogen hydrolase, partial [Opitutaceae bacterium]
MKTLLCLASALAALPCLGQPAAAAAQSGVPWAPRPEEKPMCQVDPGNDLVVYGAGNKLEFGGWALDKGPIKAGSWYRLSARYRAESVDDERRQVIARIDWLAANGERAGQPDYAFETQEDGAWRTVTLSVPAPAGAATARIELLLAWAPNGKVRWNSVSLEPTHPPAPRPVRLGTVHLRSVKGGDNIGLAVTALDAIAADHPDIVCLGEEITVAGETSYLNVAEPIPGPSTQRLGEAARRHSMYVVAGLTERDGPAYYNTTV